MPYYYPIKSIRDQTDRQQLIDKLLLLRRQMDAQIPQKTEADTMLLATWNIREFGNNRTTESSYYIAEILSRFDLVAVQEVSSNLKGLQKVLSLMGPQYSYIVTDSTDGSAGGGERMAFVYDTAKITFKNEVGELVLPKEKLITESLQFARTPFVVAFKAKWFTFKLATVHIYYGTSSSVDSRRLAEIDTVAAYLAKRSKKEDESYILLGDFNIFKTGDATLKALEKNGFHIPEAIKHHPTDLGQTKHYDQIAFHCMLDPEMVVFSEGKQRSGAFNFTESVYTAEDMPLYRKHFPAKVVQGKNEQEIQKYYMSTWRTFQMSDHLPLWAELKIDFSNEYLESLKPK